MHITGDGERAIHVKTRASTEGRLVQQPMKTNFYLLLTQLLTEDSIEQRDRERTGSILLNNKSVWTRRRA